MNRWLYDFYESRFFRRILALTGRVPAGMRVGWGCWMTLGQAQRCVGPGWADIIQLGFERCMKKGWRIHQIKEKYGTLRFYADGPMDSIERTSENVCEECGRPGKLRTEGWYKTLCDSCNAPDVRNRRRERNWQ